MGRTEAPFLYDPPPRYPHSSSGNAYAFNPKTVTQTSWAPRPPRQQKNAPLVNFNRHPDTWGVIPNGMSNVKTMSSKTKGRVKWTRLVQLFLRIPTLVGALGVLFCVICINKTTVAVGWIIRVGPCVSILHTLYAIYHLCRSSKCRTPASSASYNLFAAILDAGLIPFYVITAILAEIQHSSGDYNWDTLIGTPQAADKIINAAFLACSVVGALHLVSLMLSLYLAVIFTKISKLPPDMNPLEDNLTARPHKRNKSEFTEKHLSQSTTDTDYNRFSQAQDPLIEPPRTIPFMHTRNDSAGNVSLNRSIRDERSSYHSAHSHQSSRSDLPSQQFRQQEQEAQPRTSMTRSPAHRRGSVPPRPQLIIVSDPANQGNSHEVSAVNNTRDTSAVSSLLKDNWFVHSESPPSPPLHNGSEVSPLPSRTTTPNYYTKEPVQNAWEEQGDTYDDLDRSGTVVRNAGATRGMHNHVDQENHYSMVYSDNLYVPEQDLGDQRTLDVEDKNLRTLSPRHPLGMNPPTPQPAMENESSAYNPKGSARRSALSSIVNPSAGSADNTQQYGEPESKYQEFAHLRVNNKLEDPESEALTSGRKESSPPKTRWRRKSGKMSAYESLRMNDDSDSDNENGNTHGEGDRKGRVVSNSGIDLGLGLGSGPGGYSNYIANLGVGRRREVSGKMAEEGRVGAAIREREAENKPKGRRLSKTGEIKAAGWARFRGL